MVGVKQPPTKARIEIVRLYNDGLRCTAIVAMTGYSKNSVVGHLHRARKAGEISADASVERKYTAVPLGMPSRTRAERRGEMQIAQVSAPARADEPPPVLSRHRTCQHIAGEKGGGRRVDFQLYQESHVFCGEPALQGSSYCPEHERRTHQRRRAPSGYVSNKAGNLGQAYWR